MMPLSRGGFLIRFDEEQRTTFLKAISSLDQGFSDALSSADWPVRYWEVCGLLFEPKVITHWALARRGNKVATGKVRVDFIEVVPTHISVTAIEQRVGTHISANIVRTRSGVGGPLAPDAWGAMKAAVGEINASSLAQLERPERLADQSRERIERPGTEVVAQQRDAVGFALDVFDETGQLRRRTLKSWAAPAGDRLSSFLDGLPRVRIIEDQLVAHDAAVFPEASSRRPTVVGSVFSLGDRQLEVFNVNRTSVTARPSTP